MPHTITLYCGGPGFYLPEISPYVTKTEVQLKIAGLPYVKERARPDMSPKGQLPFISDGGELIADSTFIRAHLERNHGIDLDAGLDAVARAQAWAIERMIENHFGWVSAYIRWQMPDNFEKGPAHFFDGAPEAIRDTLRADALAQVTNNLRAVGIGRHTPDEIMALGDRSLAALSAILGDKPYLMGARPCGVDATAFAALAGVLTPFFESALRRKANAYPNLIAYVDRMMLRYYPDHPWRHGAEKSLAVV